MSLSPHAAALLSEYRQKQDELKQLSQLVYDRLRQKLIEQGLELNALECRVKTEQSLAGKLERKGDKYQELTDITDLVGLRVVTFYTDDVDKVAAIVKHIFNVDWKNSIDKRKTHELTSFGYLSLHYICYLRKEQVNDNDTAALADIPFEIQMRTALQHVWSAIEHDIGYKGGTVKLPAEYRRQFSRLAGMLELADDEFSRLRITMTEYRRQVKSLVKSGHLDELLLSTDSFRNFLDLHPFSKLNQRIAAVNQAELFPASHMSFLPLLESYGLETLGDVQKFIADNTEDAYQLALSWLAVTDLDILTDTIALQNLCLVCSIKRGEGLAGVERVYNVAYGYSENNEIVARTIMDLAKGLPFYK